MHKHDKISSVWLVYYTTLQMTEDLSASWTFFPYNTSMYVRACTSLLFY